MALIKYIMHAYTSSQNNILRTAVIIYVYIVHFNPRNSHPSPGFDRICEYRDRIDKIRRQLLHACVASRKFFYKSEIAIPQASRIHSCTRLPPNITEDSRDEISWRDLNVASTDLDHALRHGR